MVSKDAVKEFLEEEIAADERIENFHSLFNQAFRYGMLRLGGSILAGPFETIRILRQVQYESAFDRSEEESYGFRSPHSSPENNSENINEYETSLKDEERRSKAMADIYANDGKVGGGFYGPADLVKSAASRKISGRDTGGYFSELSYQTSQWSMFFSKRSSFLNSMKVATERQGLFSLWKGTFVSWTRDILMEVGKATSEEFLEDYGCLDRISLSPHLCSEITAQEVIKPALVMSTAQGLMGLLLSPLELVKVRLSIQSVWPDERKYSSSINCLFTIIKEEEGGVLGLFRHPILTLATSFLDPLLRILPVTLLNGWWEQLHSDASNIPLHWSLLWMFVQNAVCCLPILFTLPMETIRRRLLAQPRFVNVSNPSPLITRVPLSPRPYTGFLNCLYRMVREEGVSSLFQGWALKVAGTSASFLATFMAELGEEDLDDSDDLEL